MVARTWIILAAVAIAVLLVVWIASDLSAETATSEPRRLEIDPKPASRLSSPRAVDSTPESRDALELPAERIRPTAFDPRNDTEEPAGLVIRAIWGDDKTAAPGVSLRVMAWNAPDFTWNSKEVVTGKDGRADVTGLFPGTVLIVADRGGRTSTEVVSGRTEETTIEIPPGLAVSGLVLDRNRKPVAEADICISQPNRSGSDLVAGQSDAKGAFFLRDVAWDRALSARAAGYAASEPVQVGAGVSGQSVSLELHVGDRGGVVRGVVNTTAGVPIARARVNLEAPPTTGESRRDGTFEIGSVPIGSNTIAVRATGFAPWSGVVDVTAEAAVPIDVTLAPEAVVVGTVKSAEGAPIANAIVNIGRYGDFLSTRTRTAADGTFRLAGLAAGSAEITAELRGSGKVTEAIECVSGSAVTWNAVIGGGRRIVGVIRNEREQPVPGWVVEVRSHPGDRSFEARSRADAQGRFVVANCPPDDTLQVAVFNPKARSQRVEVDDVHPDEKEDLVIHVKEVALGVIKGRVLEADGSPARASIRLSGAGKAGASTAQVTPESGAFATAPLVPGAWRVYVDVKPGGSIDLGEFVVQPGATVDLGDVKLEAKGSLAIDLTCADEVANRVKYLISSKTVRERGKTVPWSVHSEVVHRELPLKLTPGAYTLTVTGTGLVKQGLSFEISSGRETRLSVTPEVGIICEFRFAFLPGENCVPVSFGLRPPGGNQQVSGHAVVLGTASLPSGTVVLAPGSYRLDFSTQTGRRGDKEVSIAATPSRQTIEIDVGEKR